MEEEGVEKEVPEILFSFPLLTCRAAQKAEKISG